MAKNSGLSENLSEALFAPFFETLLTSSSQGIAFVTPDFKLKYANEQMIRMVGASKVVKGKSIEQVLPGLPRETGEILKKVQTTGERYSARFNSNVTKKNGQLSIDISVNPVNDNKGQFLGWVITLWEVIESKLDEFEIVGREMTQIQFLQYIYESATVGIIVMDGASFRVKWANQAYFEFINKPIDKLIGQSLLDHLPEDIRNNLSQALQIAVASGEPFTMEIIEYGDNYWNCRVIPISISLEIPDLVFVVHNITEQISNWKKANEFADQAEKYLYQLEAVIENMEDGVILFDLNGKILKSNMAAVQLLGYDSFEDCPDNLFENRNDFELYDLDGNHIEHDEWPQFRIVRGEIVHNLEAAVWRASVGKIRYLSYNGALIKDSSQTSTLAIMTIRDISDRESLLRELEQEHSRLQAVLEQMPCGVIMLDACSLKQILVNKKYNEIWQVPKAGSELTEECQPGKMFHLDGRSYQNKELPIFRSINNGEIVSNEEMICQRKNGSIMNVICNSTPILDRDNNIVAGVLVFSDITELKEATTKAAIANQLQKIIEFLPDGIFVTDHERKVIAWNRALEMLTGVKERDVIGAEIKVDLFDGLERLMFIDDILNGFSQENDPNVYKNGDVISKQVLFSSLNNRDNVLLDVKATPIRNEHGSALGVIEIIRDITNQRKMEMEAIRIQKLESLGILAGGIAHDFNNILAAIIANLQLAAIKLQKRQDISKYLENTIATTHKASSLTKQLLTFAKGGGPVKKMVFLSKLVRETVNFALCGSKIKAVFRLPENLWPVDADEGQIIQVINNLIINSEQAMPEGGIINIKGENITYDNSSKYNPGNYVKLTITDHGEGVPEEIVDKIFDPFFTTKAFGSGLGLSTSYSIIKKHNGYLELESSSESGATFSILLPATTEEPAPKELPKEINTVVKAKLLLLDDEDVIRSVSGELLSLFGYRVILARDGREAIELYQQAKESGDPFIAVIMDLTIPGGMGGLETMNILRKIDPEIKAIVSSGYANDPVISDYQKYGFSGVVIKPYRFDDLLIELEKVIEKKQLPLDFTY